MKFSLSFLQQIALVTLLWVLQTSLAVETEFTNPLIETGPDPWIIQHKDYYYYMCTRQDNLTIWKTKDPTDIKNAEEHVVYLPPSSGEYSKELWAPELHRINESWYIYYAASDGDNTNHKLYVLENKQDVPTDGKWTFMGKLQTEDDKWAIDMTAFENKGQWYAIWSAFEVEPNLQETQRRDGKFKLTNVTQQLLIATLDTPTNFSSKPVLLSTPEFDWERATDSDDVFVNEGPEILKRGESLFLIYSAGYCNTDNYTLGLFETTIDSDLMDPKSWKKSQTPVFVSSPEAQAYGVGHNTFFKSPDGKQDWILYHGNPLPGQGCDIQRSSRAQPFTWNKDGTPNFGTPTPLNQSIAKPTGLYGSQYNTEGLTGKVLFLVLIIGGFVYYFAFFRRRNRKISSRIQ